MPRLRPSPEARESPRAGAAGINLEKKAQEQEAATDKEQATIIDNATQEDEVLVVEKGPERSDADTALQKQIEALKRSEQAQRDLAEQYRQREEAAIRHARERESAALQSQREALEGQELTVDTSLRAAKSEIARAERDIQVAIDTGDSAAQASAYSRLASAHSEATLYARAKEEIEARKKFETERPRQQYGSNPEVDRLPPPAQAWVRKYPQVLEDQYLNAKLQVAYHEAKRAGHPEYSDPFFVFIEEQLGFREKKEAPVEDDSERREDQQRSSIMSAPVSREVPSASGQRSTTRITLTRDQKEAAKMAGISDIEYAKNLQKLNEQKAAGNYGERR